MRFKGVFHTCSSVHLIQTEEKKNDTLLQFSSGPLHFHIDFLQTNQEA